MSVKASNGYPFTTRKQVIDRIASEPAFVVECVHLIDGKWMASHKTRALKVVAKLAAGNLSPEEHAEAMTLVMSYTRTISRILRERDLAARPELAAQAAVFGVVHPAATETRQVEATTKASAATSTAEATVVMKRRPGRPKGSKNKPKPDSAPKRQRRG